jgi:hypothetical protein
MHFVSDIYYVYHYYPIVAACPYKSRIAILKKKGDLRFIYATSVMFYLFFPATKDLFFYYIVLFLFFFNLHVFCHQDLLYPKENLHKLEETRLTYCLHCVNHVLKYVGLSSVKFYLTVGGIFCRYPNVVCVGTDKTMMFSLWWNWKIYIISFLENNIFNSHACFHVSIPYD